jgi:S-adenosylmethionine:tRNA ribosyltransferase-isomerase
LKIKNIKIDNYDYPLPDDRIAQFPVPERDMSKLLILKNDRISEDIFRSIDEYVPSDSLLVFNNSKVIRARLLFGKETGAVIEILCLEPLMPADYDTMFTSKSPVEWKCIVGNLKKWKKGLIKLNYDSDGKKYQLQAERLGNEGDAWRIRFKWDSDKTFEEVLNAAGHIPLPPYIERNDELSDAVRYQTVYSSIMGSVAAPTAGLHFTGNVLEKLRQKGIRKEEITLHVGAGTFKPMKSDNAYDHEMHCEHFFVSRKTIKTIIEYHGRIIPVGTTSVRTLESLYHIGAKACDNKLINPGDLTLGQWEAYDKKPEHTVNEALNALLNIMDENNLLTLHLSTSIMIVPGYSFRLTSGIITNFHQPRSTLLLLISAWTGERWKEVYRYAIENGFRFLSYGDSSLLLR